jgi:hypothetical protein
VIQQATEQPAPKLRTLAPLADRDLQTICAKCLEREPQTRYRSAGELAEDLERWLEGRPIIARPVSPPVRICRWSKRNPKLAGSVAACLLLSAVAGQFEIQNRVSERETALSMHSIAVEPFLDLDLAQYDVSESGTLAAALQRELSNHGPARVIPVSRARRATVGGDAGEVTDKVWNGARIAMQGTKRVRGDKLRLSLRLLNTADNTVIYRRLIEADDAKRLLLDVVKAIADNINALLSAPRLSSIESTEVDPGWRDASSRELLIAGKAVQERRTLVDMTRAADLFERAVKAKPNSALAYSWLAEAQYGRAYLTGNSEFLSAAEASAQVALQLNPTIADTHKALGLVLFEQGRFNESLEEAFTAFELADQDDSRLPARVASNLRMLGNPAQAAAWYRLGLGKNARPGNYEFSLADCLVDLVDDKRALAIYSRASILFPELPEGWIGLCRLALLQKDFALAHKISAENWTHYRDYVFSEEMAAQVEFFSRNFAEAKRLYADLAARDPNGGCSFYGAISYASALGYLYMATHDEAAAEHILQETLAKELKALRLAPRHPEILYRIAAIEASQRQPESAIGHLASAIQNGWVDYRSLDLDPRFDTLRGDPRYQRIVSSITARVTSLRTTMAPLNGN